MMIVDSQVHIWAADTPERPWPPVRRRVRTSPRAHGRGPSGKNGCGGRGRAAILVPPSWEGDRNDVVLAAAHRYPERFAVMGRISLEAPRAGRHSAADTHRRHARLRFTFHTESSRNS